MIAVIPGKKIPLFCGSKIIRIPNESTAGQIFFQKTLPIHKKLQKPAKNFYISICQF